MSRIVITAVIIIIIDIRIRALGYIDMEQLDVVSMTGDDLRRIFVSGDGYCLLINHGIDMQIIKAAFDAAKKYHALPIQRKLLMKHKGDFKGYQPIDAHISHDIGRVDNEKLLPNHNESVFFKREDNIWPDDIPGFQHDVETAADKLENLSQKLVVKFVDMLDISHIASMFPKPLYYTLRLTRYPKMQYEPGRYGLAAHRDTSFMTLLCQDGNQGLSVRDRFGIWHDVPGDMDKIVLVAGLQLRDMTFGEVIAAPHRIVGGEERYAMPFFVMAETNISH
jgi:isopenicillin N synthase-like dioxygenase